MRKLIFMTLNLRREFHKKNKFNPSNQIIKSNEDLIIDNNENFIVLNKSYGSLFRVEQNQKKLN